MLLRLKKREKFVILGIINNWPSFYSFASICKGVFVTQCVPLFHVPIAFLLSPREWLRTSSSRWERHIRVENVIFALRTSLRWNVNTKCRIKRGCAECIHWRKWILLLADSFPCMNCRLSFSHLFNRGWIIFLNYKSYSNNTHLNLLLHLLCFPSVWFFDSLHYMTSRSFYLLI